MHGIKQPNNDAQAATKQRTLPSNGLGGEEGRGEKERKRKPVTTERASRFRVSPMALGPAAPTPPTSTLLHPLPPLHFLSPLQTPNRLQPWLQDGSSLTDRRTSITTVAVPRSPPTLHQPCPCNALSCGHAMCHACLSPAYPGRRSVIWKLMSFTCAMITLPIGTYFFTAAYVFKGACLGLRPILRATHPDFSIDAVASRQCNVRGWSVCAHGKRCPDCLRHHGLQG